MTATKKNARPGVEQDSGSESDDSLEQDINRGAETRVLFQIEGEEDSSSESGNATPMVEKASSTGTQQKAAKQRKRKAGPASRQRTKRLASGSPHQRKNVQPSAPKRAPETEETRKGRMEILNKHTPSRQGTGPIDYNKVSKVVFLGPKEPSNQLRKDIEPILLDHELELLLSAGLGTFFLRNWPTQSFLFDPAIATDAATQWYTDVQKWVWESRDALVLLRFYLPVNPGSHNKFYNARRAATCPNQCENSFDVEIL